MAAPAWDGPPVWSHGDLLAGNVLVKDGRLCGLIRVRRRDLGARQGLGADLHQRPDLLPGHQPDDVRRSPAGGRSGSFRPRLTPEALLLHDQTRSSPGS
nr:phosphotransferase [Micromonospora narathiwatensis]